MPRIVGGKSNAFFKNSYCSIYCNGNNGLISKKVGKNRSIEKICRTSSTRFAGLGTIVMIIVIGALVFAQVENQDIPLPIMVIFILVVIIPGFLLMVAPIKGYGISL